MRKIFEYIGLLTLMCFSFFLTEKTVTIAEEMDSIMVDIRNNYKIYERISEDATIENNKIIPGVCGSNVNIKKSYHEMKKIGMYDKNLYQYDYFLPKINIRNNLDKYIYKGNSFKNYIYIFINLNNSNKDVLKLYEFHYYNFIIQYDFYKNNKELIDNLINNDNSILIENTSYKELKTISKYYNKESNNIYCYNNNNDNEFLKICSENKSNSISKIDLVSSNFLYNIKLTLKKGNFYRFALNENLIDEIQKIEKYVNQKGITITNVDKNLKEC